MKRGDLLIVGIRPTCTVNNNNKIFVRSMSIQSRKDITLVVELIFESSLGVSIVMLFYGILFSLIK